MAGNNDGSGNGNGNGASSSSTNTEISAMHDFIAGGIAGSASVIVGHPFDTIKVRMQTSGSKSNTGGIGGTASIQSSNSASNGATTTTSLSTTNATNNFSLKSLFRGMAAPLSTAAIVNAIIFSSYGYFMRVWETTTLLDLNGNNKYNFHGTMTGEGAVFVERGEEGLHEYIKHHSPSVPFSSSASSSVQDDGGDEKHHRMDSGGARKAATTTSTKTTATTTTTTSASTQQPPQSDSLRVFACGAMAGTAQAFVICPMEHIKCRLQIVGSTYHGSLDACVSITKSHGIFRGLYRGMGVTLWRETPAFGMYFATYDAAKARAERLLKGGGRDMGIEDDDRNYLLPSHAHAWAASALAGGISGAWTWAIIYPFDVIKTHIQTGSLDCRKSMWTVGHEIVRTHGIRHMFRGLGVTLARAFPVNAVIFPTYEFVLLQLGDGG